MLSKVIGLQFCRSKMLFFEEGGKPKNLEKNDIEETR